MANPYVNSWIVEGTSVDKVSGERKKYKVSVRQNGNWACDCPTWKWQKGVKNDCQHILKQKLFSSEGQYKPVVVEEKVESTRTISFDDV